ncbi:TMEM175 family protein [Leifsonia sp. NPDC058248]|uniref:TMEM175 family protein n=1 Tax=Leifsonia sp. NPDC058248 TaxID=3346402 RepID=UPI0036D80B0B
MRAITTERGLDRLVNFSDAAVAIAITLLVLPLVDIAGEIDDLSVGELVAAHWGAVLGFALSFIVIGRFWTIHHRVFEWVDSYSRPLLWTNLAWLASIAFIPFTTNVLSNAPNGRADVYALYVGTMVVTTAAMLLMEVILQRNPQLVREDSRDEIDLLRASTPLIILVLCLVLVVVLPSIGMWWLLLLLLSGPLHSALARVVRRRPGARGRG